MLRQIYYIIQLASCMEGTMGMSRVAGELKVQGVARTALLIIMVLISQISCTGAQATTTSVHDESTAQTDREVVTAPYNATDGHNWSVDQNWLTNSPLRDWYGVEVESQGLVVKLVLCSNQLGGEIPEEFGNLIDSTRVFLRGNQLGGCAPESL